MSPGSSRCGASWPGTMTGVSATNWPSAWPTCWTSTRSTGPTGWWTGRRGTINAPARAGRRAPGCARAMATPALARPAGGHGRGGAGLSRAAIHARYREAVRELDRRPAGLPRRLIVFGISSLPHQVLEALEALADFTQILVCVHNPCEHYWADIVADKDLLRARRRRQSPKPGMPERLDDSELHNHAQPLLAAWGKQGRDYIRLLDEHDDPAHYRHLIESLSWQRIDLFRPHGGDCLLHQLQDDIRELRPLAETRAACRRWPPMTPRSSSTSPTAPSARWRSSTTGCWGGSMTPHAPPSGRAMSS